MSVQYTGANYHGRDWTLTPLARRPLHRGMNLAPVQIEHAHGDGARRPVRTKELSPIRGGKNCVIRTCDPARRDDARWALYVHRPSPDVQTTAGQYRGDAVTSRSRPKGMPSANDCLAGLQDSRRARSEVTLALACLPIGLGAMVAG